MLVLFILMVLSLDAVKMSLGRKSRELIMFLYDVMMK